MRAEITQAFDFNRLPIDVAEQARGLMHQYAERRQMTVVSYIQGGLLLLRLKEVVGQYGQWLPALQAMGTGKSTAEEQMQAARAFGEKCPTVGNFSLDVVRLLARKYVPEELREAVLEGGVEPTEEAIKEALGKGGGPRRALRAVARRAGADPLRELLEAIADYIEHEPAADPDVVRAFVEADIAEYEGSESEIATEYLALFRGGCEGASKYI